MARPQRSYGAFVKAHVNFGGPLIYDICTVGQWGQAYAVPPHGALGKRMTLQEKANPEAPEPRHSQIKA